MQVLEVLNELIDEMDLAEEAVVASAVQHIHSNEVIMTFGLSQTTLKFLVRAAERRTFQVRRPAPSAPDMSRLSLTGTQKTVLNTRNFSVYTGATALHLPGLTPRTHAVRPLLFVAGASTWVLEVYLLGI